MDDKLFNDIEKEIKESSTIDLTFPIDEEVKQPHQNLISLIIAVLTGILLACIVFLVLLKGGKEENATIPVFEKYEESFKEDINDFKKDEIDEEISIYNSTRSFDEEAQALIEKKEEIKAKQAKAEAELKAQKEIEATKAKEKLEAIKTIEIAKTAPVKTIENPAKPITIRTTDSNLWSIQLLSGASEVNVENQWNKYLKAYPNLLSSQEHSVQKAIVKGKTFYRLRIVNIKNAKSARELCNKLKNNQINCFVTK